MALAIRRGDLERVALYLTIAMLRAFDAAPPGTVDDVLALLAEPRATGRNGAPS
ncbi:MAG: hypothetical protein IVW36_11240 [Dehalococcoidia bacterium]|nr:hypothetical protein [Dehalococcoidia bacterium]